MVMQENQWFWGKWSGYLYSRRDRGRISIIMMLVVVAWIVILTRVSMLVESLANRYCKSQICQVRITRE